MTSDKLSLDTKQVYILLMSDERELECDTVLKGTRPVRDMQPGAHLPRRGMCKPSQAEDQNYPYTGSASCCVVIRA